MGGLSLLFLGGCVTPEPSVSDPVNTANYFFYTLESRVDAELREVIEAFDETMEELQFVRTDIDREEENAVLTYRGAGDVGVTVKLKELANYTNIKIRYGLTGHEHQSRRILEQVVDDLPAE